MVFTVNEHENICIGGLSRCLGLVESLERKKEYKIMTLAFAQVIIYFTDC